MKIRRGSCVVESVEGMRSILFVRNSTAYNAGTRYRLVREENCPQREGQKRVVRNEEVENVNATQTTESMRGSDYHD